MTVAIDFSMHPARLLKAGPGGLGPSLDNQSAGSSPSTEAWTGSSSAAAIRFDGCACFPSNASCWRRVSAFLSAVEP